MLGRVKRWGLAMLAPKAALRVAPVPPREERGAFDPPSASLLRKRIGARNAPARSTASGGSNKELWQEGQGREATEGARQAGVRRLSCARGTQQPGEAHRTHGERPKGAWRARKVLRLMDWTTRTKQLSTMRGRDESGRVSPPPPLLRRHHRKASIARIRRRPV